ncbi:hypothetical protein CIRG_03586 [Coccidioides immitis RMSCC 2394]|uniref:Uncharacterized protein n=1 Tax=Coccidioides immitis RMSCC 2394 TaxID=404692 RepID=A0A0J6YA26_COCIT|nr:hypothetical protein CIRG_03586 [Coccidioides immitis RMSCC 2394]
MAALHTRSPAGINRPSAVESLAAQLLRMYKPPPAYMPFHGRPLARIHGTAVQEPWSLKLKLNPRAIVDNSEVKSRRLMMYLSALPAILYNASRGTSSQGPKVRHLAEKKHRSPAPLNYVA